MSAPRRFLFLLLIPLGCAPTAILLGAERESFTGRFFDQLRERGLYTLAEQHAERRLADPQLSVDQRIDFVIELSRTLAAHAAVVGDDQQAEFWERASAVIDDELTGVVESPQRRRLEFAAAEILETHSRSLVFDLETSPFNEPARDDLQTVTAEALRKLSLIEKSLSERQRTSSGKRKETATDATNPAERELAFRLHWLTADLLQARARLSSGGSPERLADLQNADEHFRKVMNSPEPDDQLAAKLGLAVSNRLRDELDRALEMLDTLERDGQDGSAQRLDAVRIERARLLLASHRPDAAAKELLQLQSGRDRLSGEFWLTQLQALAAMRRVAADRRQPQLINGLEEQAQQEMENVDRQAGGIWSQRCRLVWSQAKAAEQYGHRLAALVAQARAAYVAGRAAEAMKAYSSACDLAQENGQEALAFEVGTTLAGILAENEHWEELVQRVDLLTVAWPDHTSVPEINLWRIYGLGKLLDREPTEERRAAYAQALEDHLQKFAKSPTAGEVESLQGRLAETEKRYADAMAAYARVADDHKLGSTAAAGLARCGVLRMLEDREAGRHERTDDQQLVELLSSKLKTLPEQTSAWNDAQAELVYHAVKAWLLVEPARLSEAERWVGLLEQATRISDDSEEESDQRLGLRQRIAPLRLVILAGRGQPQQTSQVMKTLSGAGVFELLAVVEELGQLETSGSETARRNLIETQLTAAEMLDRRGTELTPAQQQRLDLALAKSYFATSQPAKAIAAYQRILDRSPRDVELLRRLGTLLQARNEQECRQLSKTCWQRAEGLLKQGSEDWLDARWHLIESCLLTGELERARKLMAVTKLLYPKLGGSELSQRYAELEARMN